MRSPGRRRRTNELVAVDVEELEETARSEEGGLHLEGGVRLEQLLLQRGTQAAADARAGGAPPVHLWRGWGRRTFATSRALGVAA